MQRIITVGDRSNNHFDISKIRNIIITEDEEVRRNDEKGYYIDIYYFDSESKVELGPYWFKSQAEDDVVLIKTHMLTYEESLNKND